jgi:hypothetical protein
MKKKKLFQFLVVFATLVTIQMGCQKENLGKHPNSINDRGGGFVSSCGESVPGNSVLELMVNPDDAEDTRINYILYHYAQAVRKAAANTTKRCQMVNALLATEGGLGTIPLLQFAQDNPATFGDTLNSDIKLSISDEEVYPKGVEVGIDSLVQVPSWDANAFLRMKATYNSDTLDEPVIYFVKAPQSCDLNQEIVIVIGTDVDDCDDVAGWRGNEEIILSEAETDSTRDIVIFVGFGQRNLVSSLIDPKSQHNFGGNIVERANIDIDVDEHRIKKRWDRSRRSEVMGQWTYYDPSVGSVEDSGLATDFDPRKIHKNDIGPNGTLYTDDKKFFSIPNISWSIHVAVYEKDWYASFKDIKNNCVENDNYTMVGRRKFSSEVYLNECVIPAYTWFPSVGSTKSFDNNASYFKFKRRN